MPTAPRPTCAHWRCTKKAVSGSVFCRQHRGERLPSARAARSSAAAGYGYRWQKLRKHWLLSHPLCAECERNGIVKPALHVDHIIPKALGGKETDANLQSLCASCHSHKTAEEIQLRKRGGRMGRIVIVAGPPGSGKSTYVKSNAKWGDLILDLDSLIQALSGLHPYEKPPGILPVARVAYDAVVDQLQRGVDVRMAWVIGTLASLSERVRLRDKLAAQVVVLEVPPETCLARIQQDERRKDKAAQWRPIVEAWWRKYTPDDGDMVIGDEDGTTRPAGEVGGTEADDRQSRAQADTAEP